MKTYVKGYKMGHKWGYRGAIAIWRVGRFDQQYVRMLVY